MKLKQRYFRPETKEERVARALLALYQEAELHNCKVKLLKRITENDD